LNAWEHDIIEVTKICDILQAGSLSIIRAQSYKSAPTTYECCNAMASPVSDSFELRCEDLRYAVEDASVPSFFVNEGGVLLLNTGRIGTDVGEGLFGQAVL
jgi:hypothetical protein